MRIWLLSFLFLSFTVTLPAQNLCELDSVEVKFGTCQEGLVDVWLSFTAPTLHSENFVVRGNGQQYGNYAYANLPVNIGPLELDPTLHYEFVIQDQQIDTCYHIIDYGKASCDTPRCHITEAVAKAMDSCTVDNKYAVWLNFKAEGFSSFDLYINGNFYAYYHTAQLPLLIKDFPASSNTYDFIKIYANDRSDCYKVIELAAPDCIIQCGFQNSYVKAVECQDSSFYVKMGLEHDHQKDSFRVKVNGERYGDYSATALPLILGPFRSGETSLHFLVQDLTDTSCQADAVMDGRPCKLACEIADLSTDIIRCDSGTFDLRLNFFYQGDLSDSFRIKGNGQHYGYFAYQDLPITLLHLPADHKTPYEFIVIDQERTDCSTYTELGTIECHCLLQDLHFGSGDCTSDSTYVVELSFETALSDSFQLSAGDVQLGTFSTRQLPLRLKDFPASGHQSDLLTLCFQTDTLCCLDLEIEAPACVQTDCQISQLTATALNCQEGQYYVVLDFLHDGLHSEFFVVKSDGEVLGEYQYEKLPWKIGPFKAENAETINLEIYDTHNADCHQTFEVEAPACNCGLGEIKVTVGSCTSDSTYLIELDVEMEGNFDFFINGHFCGTFDSDELPRVFEDFPASGGPYDYIKICGVDSTDCCKERKIEAPVCTRGLCGFENITYEISDCNPNNQFYVLLKFDTIGTHSETFIVQQGEHYFEYPYSNEVTRVGPFQGGNEFYKLKICDGLWHDCHATLVLGRVICEFQCDISSLALHFEECISEDYYILKIDSVKSSFKAFDLYYGDEGLGFYRQSDLPARIKVPVLDSDSITLRICVSDNLTCCDEAKIPVPSCKEKICGLSDLRLDTLECRGDSIWMNLRFNDTEAEDSSRYLLKVNGHEYDRFYFGEMPIHIGPFLAGQSEVYELELKTLAQPHCNTGLRVSGLECPANGISAGNKLLILESVEHRVFVRVPEFIEERTNFYLVDLWGRKLHQVTFSTFEDRAVLHLPSLSAGMYVIRMRSATGEIYTTKVVMP